MMILSYLEDEEIQDEDSEQYYDNLESDSWGSSVQGTWKDLE